MSQPPPDTDDAALARALLGDLAEPRPLVLLHGEAALLGAQALSDVDCVVESSAGAGLVARLAAAPGGLRLVGAWPYDCRGVGVFLATPDLRRGVHLDLLCDPDGLGVYGVRTEVLVAAAVDTDGHPWRRPDEVDGALYLLSKRTRKGQRDRVDAVRSRLADVDRALVTRRVAELLSPTAGHRVLHAVGAAGGPPRHVRLAFGVRRALEEVRRRARRLRHPIGAWVHLVGVFEDGADGLDDLWGAAIRRAPPPRGVLDRLRLLAGRWGRGATVTAGAGEQRGADTNLHTRPATARDDLAEWLTAHAQRSLRLHDRSVVVRQQ